MVLSKPCSLASPLNSNICFGQGMVQMSFQLLPPQLICKGVMLIAFQNCLYESCNPFSRVFGAVRVLLSDAFGKVDQSMEGARVAAASCAMWGAGTSWREYFGELQFWCGRKNISVLHLIWGVLCIASGGAALGAPFSIIIWLHPAWRQETLTFSCVLSLGSCSVSCHVWERFGNPSCTAATCVGQPQISPGHLWDRARGELELAITVACGHQIIYNSFLNYSLLERLL